MGRTLHFFLLIVLDLQHLTGHISSVRFHDLDHIAHAEFIALLDSYTAFMIRLVNSAQINCIALIGIRIINLRFFIRLSVIKARRKLSIKVP